jgi:signal transduction histidine kinase
METRRAQIGATQVGIDVKSYIGVPILVGAHAIGVVSVQSIHHEGRFDEDDQHLLMTIAANVGVAIERARHYASEQRRAEQFRVINEVSHGITSILDVERLLHEIVQDIQSAFGYYVVGISLIEGDELVVKAIVPRQLQTLGAPPLQLKVGQEGVMGWVAGAGEPLLVPDTSQEPRFVLWPPDARTRSELAVPLKTQAGVIGVLNVESDQLNAFDHSDLTVLQSLGNQVAIAIENAQLFQTEKRRAEQFQIIAEIGRNITSLLDTNQIMQQVTQSLRQAFDYYHVGIGLIEGGQVVYRVGSGKLWDDSNFTFKPQRLRIGEEGLTGWVAAHGEPVIVSDVTQDPRYVLMQGSATRSELIAPIIVKEQIIGVLDVQSDQLEAFDNTDLAVVQSIANQIGTAFENARLYERAQELAVMQERNRLARDLHDAVTQTLFSASLIADALPPTWDSDPNQGRLLLRELRQLSRGALAEMRTLLLELRPAALVETPLGNLLRQLGEAMAGREGLLVTVNAAKDCKLPAEAHIAFYRIAQEALNNILKHSRATNVIVSLYFRTIDNHPRVEMAISDDGRGFDVDHVSSDHFGLRNMRERAQAIGAEFCVTSQPGNGTQIQVTWVNQEVAQ